MRNHRLLSQSQNGVQSVIKLQYDTRCGILMVERPRYVTDRKSWKCPQCKSKEGRRKIFFQVEDVPSKVDYPVTSNLHCSGSGDH